MQPSKKTTTMKAANEITEDSYSYEITYKHANNFYTVDEYKNGKFFAEHGEYKTKAEAADGLQMFL